LLGAGAPAFFAPRNDQGLWFSPARRAVRDLPRALGRAIFCEKLQTAGKLDPDDKNSAVKWLAVFEISYKYDMLNCTIHPQARAA
jgi:hypothetical protein